MTRRLHITALTGNGMTTEYRALETPHMGSAPWVSEEDALAMVGAAYEAAASVAYNACLVPPDGGNPTEAERIVCDAASRYIRVLRPDAAAALVARDKRIRDEALDEAAEIAGHRAWGAEIAKSIRALKGAKP